MARRAQQRNPLSELYTVLAIRRMMQKQRDAEEAAAAKVAAERGTWLQRMIDPEQMEPGSWTAVPGARASNVPFIMGQGGLHGYDELYSDSPYADQGRNWASPEQWVRYNDNSRLPDWLRTPGSGLGPAFEPSPELQELRSQVIDLRSLGEQNRVLRGSLNLSEIARAVQMAEEDAAWEQKWAEAQGIKPGPPGIADIYGPYDSSMDRYADAPPQPSMIEEGFPENAMPPPSYGWGAEVPEPDRITGYAPARPGPGPALPPRQNRKQFAVEPIREALSQSPYKTSPESSNLSWGMPLRRPPSLAPAGSLPRGEEIDTGWASEPAAPPPPVPPMPEPGSQWDNYDPAFTQAMHSVDPEAISAYVRQNNGPWSN